MLIGLKSKLWTLIPSGVFLYRKSGSERAIYLTFDDGPVANITEPLLDLLEKYNAKASFFLIGKRVQKDASLLPRILADGHAIANHSFDHPNFHKLTLAERIEQIDKTNAILKNVTGQECKLFRAPQGRWDWRVIWYLFKAKMLPVHWSRDSLDYKKEQPEIIVERFKKQPLNNGDIVLFHDDDERCIQALDVLIPYWQSQGFVLKALEN